MAPPPGAPRAHPVYPAHGFLRRLAGSQLTGDGARGAPIPESDP